MLLASSLAFFLVIFLVASILTAIAYLAFLKMKADESDAEQSDLTLSKPLNAQDQAAEGREVLGFGIEPSVLLQSGRLSSITFWDTVLAHFDFGAILQNRLDQADLRWSVGRITSMMLLVGVIALAVLMRLLPMWAALLGAAAAAMAISRSVDGQQLVAPLQPLAAPVLPVLATLGVLVAVLPAFVTPPTPSSHRTSPAPVRAELEEVAR